MEIILNKDNFEEEVLKSAIPVLVDFWAPWCGPCKIMGPIIKELAKEYEFKIKVGKVDVDQKSELSQQYMIMTIPTIKIFKQGQPIAEVMGAVTKSSLIATIEASIK